MRIGTPGRRMVGVSLVVMIAISSQAGAAAQETGDVALARLIQQQTEQFSKAGKTGDRAVLDRLLDRDVVFTNEDGSMPSRQEMIDGATPSTGKFQLVVTNFKVKAQGDVATATFVDVLTEDFHGLELRTDYHSTEVWKKRGNEWKMIASQTTIVPHEGPSTTLSAEELDQYVGTYQLAPDVRTTITREGNALFGSTNNGPKRQLLAEYRDVLFVSAVPSSRRYIQRDASGRVTGYIMSLNGNDVLVRRVA